MEQRTFKKLAPAPAEPGSSENSSRVSLSVLGPRRHLTRNACSQCRVKKAKCDGTRPSCGRCQKTRDACTYEVNKRDIAKLQVLSDYDIARLQSYDQAWDTLKNGTDQQAVELLAQIRLGVSVGALASNLSPSTPELSDSALSNQSTLEGSSGSAVTYDDSETYSMDTPQSFMDLLDDQDDWYQPIDSADGADGNGLYNIQEE
ncbi:hypothetical protein F4776DRAFT_513075 [Hypoxylon sp. NC0597]|nr:hypothetical protein F4776DRAFT_513075 [Hypoxylon sp. NC0597]